MEFHNGMKIHKDKNKVFSGRSRDEAFTLYKDWGGQNFLMPVDVSVVQEIMEQMDGDSLLDFVSMEFSVWAQEVYDGLQISALSMQNVWDVFTTMLPLLFPHLDTE